MQLKPGIRAHHREEGSIRPSQRNTVYPKRIVRDGDIRHFDAGPDDRIFSQGRRRVVKADRCGGLVHIRHCDCKRLFRHVGAIKGLNHNIIDVVATDIGRHLEIRCADKFERINPLVLNNAERRLIIPTNDGKADTRLIGVYIGCRQPNDRGFVLRHALCGVDCKHRCRVIRIQNRDREVFGRDGTVRAHRLHSDRMAFCGFEIRAWGHGCCRKTHFACRCINLENPTGAIGQAIGNAIGGCICIRGGRHNTDQSTGACVFRNLIRSGIAIHWRGHVELIHIIDRDCERRGDTCRTIGRCCLDVDGQRAACLPVDVCARGDGHNARFGINDKVCGTSAPDDGIGYCARCNIRIG